MPLPKPNYNPPFNITRASHSVLHVKDIAKSRAFYVDLIGLVVSDEDKDTIYLRGTLLQPTVTAVALQSPLTRVCNRHDVYVLDDPRWTAFQLRLNLRDTALLRLSINAPTTQPVASP